VIEYLQRLKHEWRYGSQACAGYAFVDSMNQATNQGCVFVPLRHRLSACSLKVVGVHMKAGATAADLAARVMQATQLRRALALDHYSGLWPRYPGVAALRPRAITRCLIDPTWLPDGCADGGALPPTTSCYAPANAAPVPNQQDYEQAAGAAAGASSLETRGGELVREGVGDEALQGSEEAAELRAIAAANGFAEAAVFNALASDCSNADKLIGSTGGPSDENTILMGGEGSLARKGAAEGVQEYGCEAVLVLGDFNETPGSAVLEAITGSEVAVKAGGKMAVSSSTAVGRHLSRADCPDELSCDAQKAVVTEDDLDDGKRLHPGVTGDVENNRILADLDERCGLPGSWQPESTGNSVVEPIDRGVLGFCGHSGQLRSCWDDYGNLTAQCMPPDAGAGVTEWEMTEHAPCSRPSDCQGGWGGGHGCLATAAAPAVVDPDVCSVPLGRWLRRRQTSDLPLKPSLETIFTTWKFRVRRSGGEEEKRGTIDYVLYSPEKLRLTGMREMPNVKALGHCALPSIEFPSDHLPVITELIFCSDQRGARCIGRQP
jgi:hypothetical protein